MRVLILALLMAASVAVYAKKPGAATGPAYQTITLFNGNVQLDVPALLEKEREFYHYWDKCPDGGYTVLFAAKCTRKAGMNLQLNIHDHAVDPQAVHGLYDPRKHCIRNARVLHDTTYTIGNKQYTIVATLAKRDHGAAKRSGTGTNNYHLTYYIIADGRMLEMRYNYWAEDAKGLSHWRDMSYRIANSIKWYSPGWVTAKN